MNKSRWSGFSKGSQSDNEDQSESVRGGGRQPQRKKSSISFLQKSKYHEGGSTANSKDGRPPRMRKMLGKRQESVCSLDMESVDGDEDFQPRKSAQSKLAALIPRKQQQQHKHHNQRGYHSDNDNYSLDLSSHSAFQNNGHHSNNSNNSGRDNLFTRTKKAIGRNVSFGSHSTGSAGVADSDRSVDDDSSYAQERSSKGSNSRRSVPSPSGILNKTKRFLGKGSNNSNSNNNNDFVGDSSGDESGGGSKNRRPVKILRGGALQDAPISPPNRSKTRKKGVSFNDPSLPDSVNDESEFAYDSGSTAPPQPQAGTGFRLEKKPNRERARYSVYHGQGTRAVKRKFRVRPYRAFTEPMYMTEEEIYDDSLRPSKHVETLKSYLIPWNKRTQTMDIPDQIRSMWGTPNEDGRIGSIRVEVLGCVSLNRSKPDVCAYLVCGDAALCTDVIQGYRSPMWPSTCKRAAIFPIHHAFAKLFVGVFDVRKRTNKDSDVFCGRVAIDLATLRPDTEYDTTIPLRASSFVYDKRKRGVIRIRFSLHWFSERAALVSYFQDVATIDDKNPLVCGNPTIPCADPRTFRNVAYTVHGQDLPGKYSKQAFRSSVRELNLYQVNLQRMLFVCVLDVMFYENKLVSFYMFGSAMYCVYVNSVALIPAICTGYILIQYMNNYRHYIHKTDFNFGYKALTVTELSASLFRISRSHGTDPSKVCMNPIEVDKWTKRRGNKAGAMNYSNNSTMNAVGNNNNTSNNIYSIQDQRDEDLGLLGSKDTEGKDIRPLDHREFPFSEREAYPNFGVEDALAPGTTKGGTGRLHGRLSVYYAAPEGVDSPGGAGANDEDESDLDSDHDDETVMTESQMMGDDGFDIDSASDEDDDDANLEGADFNYKKVAMDQRQQRGKTRLLQRVKLGPPQDADANGKKVPPQETLKKMENLMYKFSKNVSVEFVHSGPQTATNDGADASMDSTGMTQPSRELKTKMARKAKKSQADEYDKILGLTVSYTNPIQRIMSSFMGPVMRMMRVGIFIVRILYNLSSWRDPFLSYWLLVVLVAQFCILTIFPWRSFFFLTSLATMGPQNMFLRKYLERKARAMEEKNKNENNNKNSFRLDDDDDDDATKINKDKNKDSSSSSSNFLMNVWKQSNAGKKAAMLKEMYNRLDPSSRIPFYTTGSTVLSKKTVVTTRAVVVPYSRLKKDRFYDWPPDPTVSRATPVPIFDALNEDDDSMTQSIPEIPIDSASIPSPTLRQRKPTSNNGNTTNNNNTNNNNNKSYTDGGTLGFVPPADIAF